MPRIFGSRWLAGLGLAAAALFGAAGAARAQAPGGTCAPHCKHTHCPPPLIHCREGPPQIKFRCGCPKPICNPCDSPHWGYFQTCWTPWPYPPDWSHCPVPPPAAAVFPGLLPPNTGFRGDDMAPPPRKIKSGL